MLISSELPIHICSAAQTLTLTHAHKHTARKTGSGVIELERHSPNGYRTRKTEMDTDVEVKRGTGSTDTGGDVMML